VLFVDDAQMAELALKYLGKDGPTNVLAFPQMDGPVPEGVRGPLGDVVISVDTAKTEAEALGLALDRWIFALLAHGILHLLGYDHGGPEEAAEMEAKEQELAGLYEAA
jgi:rRNA maturation RNase YbeY